jgi:hypothetical protein
MQLQPFVLDQVCIGEKIASSTNGADKTGYLPAEDGKWIPVSHLVRVSIQSGSSKTLI